MDVTFQSRPAYSFCPRAVLQVVTLLASAFAGLTALAAVPDSVKLSDTPDDAAIAGRNVALAPPPVTREFRGVWVATVGNLDWPSRPGLPSGEQKRELIGILDRAVALGLNAVIFQVRPAGDALYSSQLEPWSAVLSGAQGVPPSPYYDPLEFAIEQAHRRGLELHAWFNPYRAGRQGTGIQPARSHIRMRRPDLVRQYGPYLWMDPGEGEVLAHTRAVILDVVKRYDVDGIHIDDYFYPYRETDRRGRTLSFPDDASWRKYRSRGGRLSRDDWRRQNVDRLVESLHEGVRNAKPWVKFGVSPFGIWRPGHPDGVFGLDSYVEIFADSRKWLRNGWVDYFAPQLYWRVAAPRQPYDRLLDWWVQQNPYGRHLWPGLFTSKAAEYDDGGFTWRSAEIVAQVQLTREHSGATGNIHFSMRGIEADRDSIQLRLSGVYNEPALVPASPWLDPVPPAAPRVLAMIDDLTGAVRVQLQPGDAKPVRFWVVHENRGGHWNAHVISGNARTWVGWDPDASGVDAIVVRAVDRVGNESDPVRVATVRSARVTQSADR
jgi:uncharacterized lipoprotein YddW (UPF0748 family)